MAKKPAAKPKTTRRKSKKLTQADINRKGRQLSNWGKWGRNDQLGVLNYITPEDIVEAAKKEKSQRIVKESVDMRSDSEIPSWLKLSEGQMMGTIVSLPTPNELQVPVEAQLVVEYMSR